MALEVYEIQETRSSSFTAGKETATRRFRVFDDASPLTTPASVKLVFGTGGLPIVGEEMIGDSTLKAVSYSIRHVPEQRNLWEVDFSYETVDVNEPQPAEIGYVAYSMDYVVKFVAAWRSNPSISNQGNPPAPEIDGVGTCAGTKIDAAGTPVSVAKSMTTLTITETVAASTMLSRIEAINSIVNKRNSNTFEGGPPGQVLYAGAQGSRIAINKYQITHRFERDDWYHMLQSPLLNQDGVPIMTGVATARQAKTVNWVQPFPQQADFATLSENF